MTTYNNTEPLPDWQIPVIHCCGIAQDSTALTCPVCNEYVNPSVRHIDISE